MKPLISVLLGFILLGPLLGQPLTIFTEVMPPSQIQDPNGEAAGPAVELVREIQKRVGNTDPIQVVPWARGYALIQQHPNTVLFSMARTAERNALFQWVGPVSQTTYSFYVRSESKTRIRKLEDAKRLGLIGVYRNDARDQLLTDAGFTNLARTNDSETIVKLLMDGRVDALVSSNMQIRGLTESAGYKLENIREAFPFMTLQTWIAFSKGTPRSIVDAWTKAFNTMKRDGTRDRILQKIPGWTPPGRPITRF